MVRTRQSEPAFLLTSTQQKGLVSAFVCMRRPFVVLSMLQEPSQEVSCQRDSACCPPAGQPEVAWLHSTAMLAQRMHFLGHCLQITVGDMHLAVFVRHWQQALLCSRIQRLTSHAAQSEHRATTCTACDILHALWVGAHGNAQSEADLSEGWIPGDDEEVSLQIPDDRAVAIVGAADCCCNG